MLKFTHAILPTENSYRTFCELTNGYRIFSVIVESIRSGIIDRLDDAVCTVDELLAASTLQPEEGRRFIALLESVGLVEANDGLFCLSLFARTYLSRSSAASQRHVLEFEPVLMENWRQLGTVLHQGQGVLIREQFPDECRQRRQLFQQAMTETARIRCRELWDALDLLPERGTIIDIGAGDGTYLREFLLRHPHWLGIACDLPEVCAEVAPETIPHNLSVHPGNILDHQEMAALVASREGSADLLLLSNLCHCYSPTENETLLAQAAALLTKGGRLIVHDFFRNANSFGALYDLHMLVNTYNGRSYTTTEMAAMLARAGFEPPVILELPSYSLALIAGRTVLPDQEENL